MAGLGLLLSIGLLLPMSADARPGPGGARLVPMRFADLPGFAADDHGAAFAAFLTTCRRPPDPRAATPAPPELGPVCARALAMPSAPDAAGARQFFETNFIPWRIDPPAGNGFLTGYYEPEVAGSLVPTPEFAAPAYARPDDLVSFAAGEGPAGLDPALAGARRRADGALEPYPARGGIESGKVAGLKPLLWLRDPIEAFMIHVQGSARIRLTDGRAVRLAYAARNGRPYTSIGKVLVERGGVPLEELTLARLKQWVRDNGQKPGEDGLALMHENRSFIFFRLDWESVAHGGPTGGAGVPLQPLRSIAIDRTLWPYGLPFFIAADLPLQGREKPLEPFAQLMIAQDTGSAILGPARADLFFGSGTEAGRIAGDIRHPGRFFVLLPRGMQP